MLASVDSNRSGLRHSRDGTQDRSQEIWLLAEFRMSPGGLRFGVLLVKVILQVVFMAPGAVMVIGNTTKPQFGKIALAGPVSNLCLWVLGIVHLRLALAATQKSQISYYTTGSWPTPSSLLFNMLPFGPLDGKKIKTWSDSDVLDVVHNLPRDIECYMGPG